MLPDKLCAPVTVVWEVTYRGVNDGGTPVEIQFNWDDGNLVQIVPAINTNPNPAIREWQATITHVYPQGGPLCNYRPEATLRVNGVLCTSSIQQQNVTVWDTDDHNGGHLEINPQVFPICVGNDGTVTFQDVSLWNCVPPVENDNPNNPTRWTQWIYGTNYTINNVLVGGVAQAYPYYGAIVPAPGPIYGPTPPNNVSLPCYSPNTALVGQFFEITLRNWNYCNPYDDPTIPGPPADLQNGDYPPIITTAIILIVPYPDATINPAGPFCSNASSVTLTAATPGGTWSGQGITNTATGQFDPSTAGPGTHTITYNVTDGNGCTGVDTLDITVFSRPTINILPGTNLQACPGDTIYIDGNPTPGSGAITTHLWTGNTGPLSATNIQMPYFTTNTPGAYNLTYRVTDVNGCYRTQNLTITIAQVSANIIPNPAQACAGIDFQLNGNPSGGTGTYTTHTWTGNTSYLNLTNIQNPVFNTTVTGNYNLTYSVTDNNGCTGSDNITITVFDVPVAVAGPDDSICGLNYTMNAVPSIGSGLWSMQNGPGTLNFTSPGSVTTSLTASQYGTYDLIWQETYGPSCTDKDTVKITFVQQPVANAGTDDSLCGLITTITALPSAGAGLWTQIAGPATATITNPNNSSTNISTGVYGMYSFQWYENNGSGCTDADTVNISFDVVPVSGFIPADTSGCPPFPVSFTNTTIGGAGYEWHFSDGGQTTTTNAAHTFTNTGTADITYYINMIATSTYGCKDSIQHQLTVHPLPVSDFVHDEVPSCSPVNVNFTNISSGAASYVWDFGDGNPTSSLQNPSHIFINNTTLIQYYEVKLIAYNSFGCPDTSLKYITVFPDPDYTITAIPDTACHPANIQLVTQPGANNYLWNYGDGTSQSAGYQVTHPYINTGNTDQAYTIQLIGTSFFGCLDTSFVNVLIRPKPIASVSVLNNTDCSPATFTFTNSSLNATNNLWYWGDGTSESSNNTQINHSYTNSTNLPMTITVSLVVHNNEDCSDSVSIPVNIYPPVTALFTADTASCSPFNAQFYNLSMGATSYIWNFGDGNSSVSFQAVHQYVNNTGNDLHYPVTLTATSVYGCSDTYAGDIYVWAKPSASFTATPDTLIFPNSAVTIDNTSSAGTWQYSWDFGDTTVSTAIEPGSHHYNYWGNYTISLLVYTLHCSDTDKKTIQIVAPAPIADFVVSSQGCAPLSVQFNNQSLYATSYQWDFGDGGYSTESDPLYIYYNSGDFPVQLTASGPGGQSIKAGGTVRVFRSPTAFFTVAPSVVFLPDQPVHCFNTSENATSFVWNFGDGTYSNEENPVHQYLQEGEYTISLLISTEHQCIDTFSVFRAVVAKSEGDILFPSAFSPNPLGPNGGVFNPNDLNNDVFHPVFQGVESYELTIYNRWGELIFETKEPNIGWDGYYRNELCKQDVYVWKAKGKFINGQSFSKAGDLTLIR